MFRVWTPEGEASEYYHQLAPGEARDNNFAAISPDGQWLVSGQWGNIDTLPVYPMPRLNPETPGNDQDLPLKGMIRLDHAIANIQGCVFTSPVQLLCSSDAETSPLGNTKPLVQVDLHTTLAGDDVSGHVTELGSLPLKSMCPGTFEVEGLDYDEPTGDLRVEVISPMPCGAMGTVWRFQRSHPAPQTDQRYVLVNAATGQAIDSPSFSSDWGTQLVSWPANFGLNQQWNLVDTPAGKGAYQLRLASNGLCMDVDGRTDSGAAIQQYGCDADGADQARQAWRLKPQPGGTFTLQSETSGLYVTPRGTGSQSVLEQQPANGAQNQRWWLVPVPSGR
jgi:hypothetical protein